MSKNFLNMDIVPCHLCIFFEKYKNKKYRKDGSYVWHVCKKDTSVAIQDCVHYNPHPNCPLKVTRKYDPYDVWNLDINKLKLLYPKQYDKLIKMMEEEND